MGFEILMALRFCLINVHATTQNKCSISLTKVQKNAFEVPSHPIFGKVFAKKPSPLIYMLLPFFDQSGHTPSTQEWKGLCVHFLIVQSTIGFLLNTASLELESPLCLAVCRTPPKTPNLQNAQSIMASGKNHLKIQ